MSKREVTIEIYKCDHKNDSGESCTVEGERQSIKVCAMCNKDLCSRHYQVLTVTRGGSNVLSYFFCPDHADEFVETLVKTFGDTRPVPYAGMAK